jgi:hypothetical protein
MAAQDLGDHGARRRIVEWVVAEPSGHGVAQLLLLRAASEALRAHVEEARRWPILRPRGRRPEEEREARPPGDGGGSAGDGHAG